MYLTPFQNHNIHMVLFLFIFFHFYSFYIVLQFENYFATPTSKVFSVLQNQ